MTSSQPTPRSIDEYIAAFSPPSRITSGSIRRSRVTRGSRRRLQAAALISDGRGSIASMSAQPESRVTYRASHRCEAICGLEIMGRIS